MALSNQAGSRSAPHRTTTRRTVCAALTVAAVLAAAACGGSSGGAAASGESVDAGASKEDFREALADMDPVEMKIQVLTPKDTAYAKAWEDYGKALDDWSDGKITFKMHYSGAIAPTGVEDALKDGLIDGAPFLPTDQPDRFPIASWATQRMTLAPNTPVAGTLQQVASVMDLSFGDEAFTEEIEQQGIYPLVPLLVGGSQNLFCGKESANSLSGLKGKQVRTSSPANEQEVKGLGATTVSIPSIELYEAVQRGTVDCVATSHTFSYAINLAEITDYWVIDPEVGLAPTAEVPAISLAAWEELPLAAQQLMHDRLDVYLKTYIQEHVMGGVTQSMQQAKDSDVQVESFESDARTELVDFQSATRAKGEAPDGIDAPAFVDEAEKLYEEWGTKVKDLGYTEDISWDELADHEKEKPTDVQPVIDDLMESVLSEHRPD